MKLTDFLNDVGRPIAYYPSLRKITGSTTAAILICQFIYWRGKESDPDGWLYKTSDEIEAETGLSYEEQKTARTKLKDAKLIEEYYARLDHQMKFRLNMDEINQKWASLLSPFPEQGNAMLGNKAFPFSLNSNTETTPESKAINLLETQELLSKASPEWALLAGVAVDDKAQILAQIEQEAINAFESAFALQRPWDWYPDSPTDKKRTWDDFRAYIVKLYQQDKDSFGKYVTWSRQPYVKGAMTALGIKRNPQDFPDSWAGYLAQSVMYKREEEFTRLL